MDRTDRSAKAEFWQQVLGEHSQSNLSAAAFCAQKDISVQSFYQWKRKLQPAPNLSRQSLVPVRIVAAPKLATSQAIQLMTPSGFSVRFDSSVEPNQLAKILEAIESTNRGESC
jgi:transposase